MGISSCLIGKKVRYDGGHTRHDVVMNRLTKEFQLVDFCPEVEMGLGTPRETIQLVIIKNKIELMPSSRKESLNDKALSTFQNFNLSQLSGYIFQTRSPSCGLGSTKLFRAIEGKEELINESEDGLFAKFIKQTFPNMPLIDSSQLEYSEKVEKFIINVKDYFLK